MASYVYLLVHAKESRFKLGKASDVIARARVLGIHNFALQKSWALKVPSETRALQVEQALHRIFDPWRVPKSKLRNAAGDRRRGDTEWFRLKVMKRMQEFVESSLDVMNGELLPLHQACELPRRRKAVRANTRRTAAD